MRTILTIAIIVITSSSFTQETFLRRELRGGKMKYEYHIHKERDHLVQEFFDLFCESKEEYVIVEQSSTAVIRKNRRGFEIIGDGDGENFECSLANLLIDCWYEYANVNSN